MEVRAEGKRRFGEATLTFEVSLDGGYYSWRAFEGAELVGEGEVLSSAGSACGD